MRRAGCRVLRRPRVRGCHGRACVRRGCGRCRPRCLQPTGGCRKDAQTGSFFTASAMTARCSASRSPACSAARAAGTRAGATCPVGVIASATWFACCTSAVARRGSPAPAQRERRQAGIPIPRFTRNTDCVNFSNQVQRLRVALPHLREERGQFVGQPSVPERSDRAAHISNDLRIVRASAVSLFRGNRLPGARNNEKKRIGG